MSQKKKRFVYLLLFGIILLMEIAIALFVRDRFIRPYGGDILVAVLLCSFCRVLFLDKSKLLPLWVFLLSVAVEIGQYFDYVTLLGLENSRFTRTLLGTTFSFADILCYGVGCLMFVLIELWLNKWVFLREEDK